MSLMSARRSPLLPYWVWILRPPVPGTGPLPRIARLGEPVLLRLPYVSTTSVPLERRGGGANLLPMFRGRPEEGLLRYSREGKLTPSRSALLETGVEAPEAREVSAHAFSGFYLPRDGRPGRPGKQYFVTQFRWNVRSMAGVARERQASGLPLQQAVVYVTPPLFLLHQDRDPHKSFWAIPGLVQRYGIVYRGTFHTRPWLEGIGRPVLDEWGSFPLLSIYAHALPPEALVKLDELLERGAI